MDGSTKPRVLLVASPDWLGVSRLPRVFARAGARVALIAHPRSFAARSRYVDELIPGTRDPRENLEILRRTAGSGARWERVIFADDPTMSAAALRAAEPWLAPWFPADPRAGAARILTNKAAFLLAASAAGLPVPAARRAEDRAGVRAAARELGYPVVVKPSEGSAGAGVTVARDAAELEARLPPPGETVVQAYVAGRTGGTAVLYDAGRPRWWMSSLRDGIWPEPYGPASRRIRCEPPGTAEVVAGLGRLLGMSGLCEFDWIMPQAGGAAQVIEFNPRPPAYLAVADELGADLSGALRAWLGGAPIPADVGPAPGRAGARAALFPEEAIAALGRGDWSPVLSWPRSADGPPRDDRRLYAAYGWLVAKAVVRAGLDALRGRAYNRGASDR